MLLFAIPSLASTRAYRKSAFELEKKIAKQDSLKASYKLIQDFKKQIAQRKMNSRAEMNYFENLNTALESIDFSKVKNKNCSDVKDEINVLFNPKAKKITDEFLIDSLKIITALCKKT